MLPRLAALLLPLFPVICAAADKPVLYLTVISHNEEPSQSRPDYTTNLNYYVSNRALVKLLAETIVSRGATFNFQSDWNYLEAVAKFDTNAVADNTSGKNIVRWMKEDRGVEIDPHAHETTRNYADVACLIQQLGVTPSKNVGGFLGLPPDNPQGWEQHAAGLWGRIFTNYFWRADHLWGASSFMHQGADDCSSGIWQPANRYDFYSHDPNQRLLYIGSGGCHTVLVQRLMEKIETNRAPSNGFYTASLFMTQDWMTTNSIAELGAFIDSLAPYVTQGRVRWATLSKMAELWRTEYDASPFRFDNSGTASQPGTNFMTQSLATWIPAPNGNLLYTRVLRPVPSLYPGMNFPAVVVVPGGTNGPGAPAADRSEYRMLASNGFVVACFNPEGRGTTNTPGNLLSQGTENYNGFVHQADLKAVIEYVACQSGVDTNNIGVQTTSYGVAIGAGCLGRYPDLPVNYLVDGEGPHDNRVITFYDAGREISVGGHRSTVTDPSPSNVAFWAEREAVRYVGAFRGRYLRIQAYADHAQDAGYFRHALEMINAATKPLYGGTGSNRWTRMNGSDLTNEMNVVYPTNNPSGYPAWLSGHLSDHTNVTARYILEMAALSTQTVSLCPVYPSTNTGFQFQLSGIAGESYAVQASTSLTTWITLQTNKLTNSTWLVRDPQAAGFDRRFYRGVLAE